jgi:glycine/D-amino acid oxidase-like deaminating enzyme
MSGPRVVIVGLGVNGLCTAWALVRAGFTGELVLLDQFPAGHTRGSSHGGERITRTSYATAAFAADARRARVELWPALERDVGMRLLTPGPAVFWGPENGPLPQYAKAIAEAGGTVEELSPAAARRRVPTMTFVDTERVLLDPHAGVVHAAATLASLEGWLADRGIRRRVCRLLALESEGDGVVLHTGDTRLRADLAILSAGPWIPRLLPALARELLPVRQHVGYWEMAAHAGVTPAWVHLDPAGLHYGLPTLVGGQMKAAFHRTAAEPEDPDVEEAADPHRIAAMEERLREWFSPGPGLRLRTETCWYTNAPGDQFRIDPAPDHPRVLVVSACSGHAFKMGPLTGTRVAARGLDLLGVGG